LLLESLAGFIHDRFSPHVKPRPLCCNGFFFF
jgi:hypothetical protein